MKRILIFLLLSSSILTVKGQTFTGSFGFKKDAQDLLNSVPDTTNQIAAYYVLRTYGTNEQRFYQWFLGTPGGGSNGMNPDSLAINLAAHYIIVPTVQQVPSKMGYWSTPKIKNTVANIPDFYTRLQAWMNQQGYNNRITADSTRLASEVTRAMAAEAAKVTANNAIVAGTGTKITADTKGLVVAINNVSQADVISALGFTPYSSSNPNNYIPASSAPVQSVFGRTGAIISGNDYNTGQVTESTNLYYTDARARNAVGVTPNSGLSYVPSTGLFSTVTPTYNNAPNRALTTSFKPSTTRPTRVSYTVSITTALSLLNLNSSGTVALQISADGTNWTTINSAGITRTLSVSITVGLNDTSLFNIQGEVPTNYFCRLLPTVSGGATATFMSGQEVTY